MVNDIKFLYKIIISGDRFHISHGLFLGYPHILEYGYNNEIEINFKLFNLLKNYHKDKAITWSPKSYRPDGERIEIIEFYDNN